MAKKPKAAPQGHEKSTLIAFMENDAMEYCQYIYLGAKGEYYAVRVGSRGSAPIIAPLTEVEARQAYEAMSVRVVTFKD